jgi:hypothetical protein
MKQLWVFRVSGGESFKLQVKGNPAMVHDGGNEVLLRSICTKKEAAALVVEMEAHGCRVTSHSTQETPEQSAERQNIMQVLGGERPFPCIRCPECAWFDPHLDSLCGAGLAKGNGWDDDAVTGSMSSEKFKEDFQECPLREAVTQ